MKGLAVSELNKTAESLGLCDCVRFYDSDAVKVACDIAPYGKVAAIYAKPYFTEFGKDITQRLKLAGIKPLNFIMPENAVLNLSNVFDVICVPDDVRAVLVFDRELIDLSAYLATLFEIPVIFTLNTVNTDGVLPSKVPFFWGGNAVTTDFFPVNTKYHVIIGENALTFGNKAEQYINIFGKLLALIDYKTKLAISGGNTHEVARETISAAANAVDSAFDAETLIMAGLKIELANLSARGEIMFNSAEYCFNRLIGFKKTDGVRFALIKRLLSLYVICAENGEMPFDIPDYNRRAKELSAITVSDDGVFLKGLMSQVRTLREYGTLSGVIAELKDQLAALFNAFLAAEKNYAALGGISDADFSPYVYALKLCGDLPDTVNFMTVLREGGFLEFD